MAWRDPRIRSFAQFLLTDAAPNPLYPKGSKAYWSTFQSGLLFYPLGRPKPAYYAFELPLWLAKPHHGPRVPIWAQIRPSPRIGTIQFRPRGSRSWINVAHVAPRDPEGFVAHDRRFAIRRIGPLALGRVSRPSGLRPGTSPSADLRRAQRPG